MSTTLSKQYRKKCNTVVPNLVQATPIMGTIVQEIIKRCKNAKERYFQTKCEESERLDKSFLDQRNEKRII